MISNIGSYVYDLKMWDGSFDTHNSESSTKTYSDVFDEGFSVLYVDFSFYKSLYGMLEIYILLLKRCIIFCKMWEIHYQDIIHDYEFMITAFSSRILRCTIIV